MESILSSILQIRTESQSMSLLASQKTNTRPLHSLFFRVKGGVDAYLLCLLHPIPPSRGLLVIPAAHQENTGWVASKITGSTQVRWKFVGRGRFSSHQGGWVCGRDTCLEGPTGHQEGSQLRHSELTELRAWSSKR